MNHYIKKAAALLAEHWTQATFTELLRHMPLYDDPEKEQQRVRLVWEAINDKPVRCHTQYDCMPGCVRDCAAEPDEDGDWLTCRVEYDLRRSKCLRVSVPDGMSKEDALRGL